VGARQWKDGLGKTIGARTAKGKGAEAFGKRQFLKFSSASCLHRADQPILKRNNHLPFSSGTYLLVGEL
jgi:hypothetical protein